MLLSAASPVVSDEVPALHLAQLLQEWEQMSGSSGDDIAERGTNLLFKSLLPVPSQIPKRSMPFLGQSHPLLVAHTDDTASAGSALFPALLLCGSATLGWLVKKIPASWGLVF